MADHVFDDDVFDDGLFVYIDMGGDQQIPLDVTHVRIHKSVKIIRRHAFGGCRNLVSIEMHDGVEIIEEGAFQDCDALKRIKLTGVRVIGEGAFWSCRALEHVEFGDKLETIGSSAFRYIPLRSIKIPKVRTIGYGAFYDCHSLTEAELSEDIETIGHAVFCNCKCLRRITLPLKDSMLVSGYVFSECSKLSQVDIVGGIHNTVSSLLLDSWKNEMNDEIDCINQDLPTTPTIEKTTAIQQWMETVTRRIEHFKSEHSVLLKEFTTLLELALWKAKLDESQDERSLGNDQPAKKAKIDMKAARQEQRITAGANIVIKNVLPFLKLE